MPEVVVAVKESAIELELMRRVYAAGGVCDKVRCLGRRGFYDRLVVLPGGKVIFVECKRPIGGRVSAHQRQWHALYRGLGVAVAIVKNLSDIDRLLGDT